VNRFILRTGLRVGGFSAPECKTGAAAHFLHHIDTGKGRTGASIFSSRRRVAAVKIPEQRLAGGAGFGVVLPPHNDQSGDQLRSTPRLFGSAGSTGAKICRRSLPPKSRCQVKNGHISRRFSSAPVCWFFQSRPNRHKTGCCCWFVPAVGPHRLVAVKRPEIRIAFNGFVLRQLNSGNTREVVLPSPRAKTPRHGACHS